MVPQPWDAVLLAPAGCPTTSSSTDPWTPRPPRTGPPSARTEGGWTRERGPAGRRRRPRGRRDLREARLRARLDGSDRHAGRRRPHARSNAYPAPGGRASRATSTAGSAPSPPPTTWPVGPTRSSTPSARVPASTPSSTTPSTARATCATTTGGRSTARGSRGSSGCAACSPTDSATRSATASTGSTSTPTRSARFAEQSELVGLMLATHGALAVGAVGQPGAGREPPAGAAVQPRDRRRHGGAHDPTPRDARPGVRAAADGEPELQPQAARRGARR